MIDRERKKVKETRAKVRAIFTAAQARWKEEALAFVPEVAKATSMVKVPKNAFGLTAFEVEELIQSLAEMAQDGALESLASLVAAGYEIDVIENASHMAQAWAQNYGGAMIRDISETTRDEVASTIATGMEQGLSNADIASTLEDGYTFSEDRAEMIANTETAYADVAGNVATYEEAGVEKKRWVLGSDSCDLCQANEDAGDIDFDDVFPSGDFAPPGHPNCTCDIIPVLAP